MSHEAILIVVATSFAIQIGGLIWIIWVAQDIHRTGLVLQETKKIFSALQ